MDEIEDQLSGGKPGHQITDSLIRALKEVESSGNPRAVNPDSGATGAFQFMPSTVKMLKKQGIDFNPFDEKESERAARTYLQMLRDKNGGDLNKALAQYGGHITKDPTNYLNKIYARMEKNAAAAPKNKAQPGDEIEQALLGKIEREPEPPAPPPLKLNQLSQLGSLGVPEGDLVRQAMKKYFAPKPVETAPAAKADQIPTTTVAPQQAAPKTEYKVGSMADLGKGIVSMADVAAGGLTGLVGQGSYAIQRAMGVPAAEAQKSVQEFVEKRTDPFGRALGISEDPAYKAEATRRLTNYIGENVGKGAAWIAEKTGIPVGDVENMIGSLGLLPIPGVAKVGQKAGAATYGAEQALRDQFAAKMPAPKVEPGIGAPVAPAPTVPTVGQPKPKVTYAELQAQLQQKQAAQAAKEKALTEFANAPTQRELQAIKAQQAQASVAPAAGVLAPPGSVGAAAVIDLSKINAALSQASPQLQAALRGVDPRQMSLTALENQLQAERLGLGVDYYTQGQALQDPRLMSNELNERGKFSDLSDRIASQDPKLKKAMDDLHDRAVQNEVGGTMYDHGVRQIEQYTTLDKVRRADIKQKYAALKDAAGGAFPIDAPQFVRNARQLLEEDLQTEFLPPTIESRLSKFEAGQPMTLQKFETLRTILAKEMRTAARVEDGNKEFALSLVRQALEDLPLLPGSQQLKAVADTARSAAKARFDALKADPAYKAAVNGAPPDTFMDKYVFSDAAPAQNIRLIRDTFGDGSIGALNVESALINHLREKGGLIEKKNVSQATYNNTFRALEEKLKAGAKPETVESLRDLGDVLYKTKARLPGSFVNESNTYVAQLAEQGVSGAAKAGDIYITAKTGVPIPVVSTAVQKLKGAFQAKKMKQTLEPAAGVRKRD
jgi:hypothetical protein